MAETPTFSARMEVRGVDDLKAAFAQVRETGVESMRAVGQAGAAVGATTVASVRAAGTATVGTARVMRGALGAVTSTLGFLGRGVSAVVGGLGSLARVAGLAGAALTGSVGGAYLAIRQNSLSVSKTIEETLRLSDALGVSVESLSDWQAAARIAGGSAEGTASAIGNLRRRFLEAVEETDPARAAQLAAPFTQLDIALRDANGSLRTTEDILAEAADALAGLSNESLRAKAAQDLFGSTAKDILPVLRGGAAGMEELLQAARQSGTRISEDQARRVSDLLRQQRRLNEAVRGINSAFGEALLPVFVGSAESIRALIESNRERITAFIRDFVQEFIKFQADLGRAFGSGPLSEIGNDLVRLIAPGIRLLRDLTRELLNVARGGPAGEILPWLVPLRAALDEAVAVARAFGLSLLASAGLAVDELPTLSQVLDTLQQALLSVRLGLEGNSELAPFPWAATAGRALGEFGRSVVAIVAILDDNKESIAAFVEGALFTAADGLESLRAIFAGEQIDGDNLFARLNVVIPIVTAAFERLSTDVRAALDALGFETFGEAAEAAFVKLSEVVDRVYTAITAGIDDLLAAGELVLGFLRTVSDLLGFPNVETFVFAILALQITNLLPALAALSFVLLNTANLLRVTLVAPILALVKAIGGFLITKIAATAAFASFVAGAKAVGAALLALVTGPIGLIVLAVAAVAAGVYFFWDEIVAAAQFAWDGISALWGGLVDLFSGFFAGVAEVAAGLWDGIAAGAAAGWQLVVDTWGVIVEFFRDLFGGTIDIVAAAWDAIAALPGAAWQSLVDLWGGLGDFFEGVAAKALQVFSRLWDGVKNGAADAWNGVKSFFGFGDDQPDVASLESFDVGGVVPGRPGQARLAVVHGQEWIFNPQQASSLSAVLASLADLATAGMSALTTAPEAQPAMAAARGPAPLSMEIDGRSFGGFYADGPGPVKAVRMAQAKRRTVSTGATPRWNGGYK